MNAMKALGKVSGQLRALTALPHKKALETD
jgi:hypothetical protein